MRNPIVFLLILSSMTIDAQRWSLTGTTGMGIQSLSSTKINGVSLSLLSDDNKVRNNRSLSVRVGINYALFQKTDKWKLGFRTGTQRFSYQP